MKILVSACLLGESCRYDGQACLCQAVVDLQEKHELIPVCPELIGGLDVPRSACEIDMSMHHVCVRGADGADLTAAFEKGAKAVLQIAKEQKCELAILKGKSPSCGSDYVYDGTFTGALMPGSGITARMLRSEGVRVINEERLQDCTDALFATSASEGVTLVTDRLTLRPLTEDDALAVFEYSQDPTIGPDAGWAPHKSVQDSLDFIHQVANAPHVFGIFENKTKTNIGSIGLIKDRLRVNPEALTVGYALARPWWGKGYMTEAVREVVRYGFEDIGLALVTADRYVFNTRSGRVLDKCNFKRDGILRAAEMTPDGIMQDVVAYSLTKQEYFSER